MMNEGLCDLCGHQVGIRQKAHIVAEESKRGINVLMLCPSCHVMFDTHVKPKLWKALDHHGAAGLPKSWEESIFDQAADASSMARGKKR